jgi:ArsR family transcriptional regulator
MSIYLDMTSATPTTALVGRLERLTGTRGNQCLPVYRSQAHALSREPAFARHLRSLRSLSDRKRLIAVGLLRRAGELCACEIQAALGLSHPAVSYHMSILVQAGLVRSERRGKWVHYTLSPEGQRLCV